MKPSENNILSWIKYILQLLSISIFSYILLAHLLKLIKPAEAYIDFKIFDISYLRFIFFLGFISGLTGWIISLFLKQITLVSISSQKIEEKITYSLTAFFLAIFYNGLFGFLKILQYPFFILLILFFYFAIPQLIQFYLSFNYKALKLLLNQTIKPIKDLSVAKKNAGFKGIPNLGIVTFILLSILISIFSFLFVSRIIDDYARGKVYKDNQLRKQFYLKEITPKKVVHAQKVTLEGYNFGWKSIGDYRYQIMTSDGPLRLIEGWTNEKVEFIVSLDIPLGKKQIWIEKPTDNSNNTEILKSNIVKLDVLDRFVFYPAVGDSLVTKIIKRVKLVLFKDVKIFNSYIF